MNIKIKPFTSCVFAGFISLGMISCDISQIEDPVAMAQNEETLEESNENARLANLLVEELFNTSTPFSNQSQQFSADHSFQVVTDPVQSSNKVGRFELRDSDEKTNGGVRSEIGFRETQREGWYSYSVFFPTSGYSRDNNPENISQWHQPDGGSPPNAVEVKDDKIMFRSINRSDTRDNSNKVYSLYSLGNVERGKWQEYVFHFVHSPNSDGLIEIWHNKKKIHTIEGPNMRRGYDLPNFKIGIYKWSWANERTQSNRRVLYFDNVRMGDETGSLLELVSGIVDPVIPDNITQPEKEDDQSINNPDQSGDASSNFSGFNLIQANIDRDLGALQNNETVDTETHKLNVRANVSSDFQGEVHFELSGADQHDYIDDTYPYTLFGDDGSGNYYFGRGLNEGSYVLEAKTIQDGEVYSTEKVAFTIR